MSVFRPLALAATVLASAAFAQSPDVIEGARRESEVMVYHSTQTEDLKPVFDAFTQKYGVKVKDWRSSSENVVQRVVSETRAGRHEVDFIENNGPEMEALRRERMLRRMDSPHFASLRPGALPAHREYVTATMDVFVQAYNTEKVRRDELPKTFGDLLDPRREGRPGIEAEGRAWLGALLGELRAAEAAQRFA